MLILGIDPGTRVMGFGLVAVDGSRFRLVEAGSLRAPREAPLERRLGALAAALRALLERRPPAAAAVEDVFVKLDPKAALAVGHARGAILAVLGQAGVEVVSYPPASVKRAVAGNGRADKQQVARMVGAILGENPPAERDTTDALAVALAHALALGSALPPSR